jgi:hypothetical protein
MPGSGKNTEEGLKKKRKLEEDESAPEPKLRRSASVQGLIRTKSLNSSDISLKTSERNPANSDQTAMAVEDMKYFSVIAVFSREASKNFGKKWEEKMKTGPPERRITRSSQKGINAKEIARRDGIQDRADVSTNFEEQVRALFNNKTVPHVVAVIEGKEEQASFSLKTEIPVREKKEEEPSLANQKTDAKYKAIEVGYKKKNFFQGYNTRSQKDHKQSMSYYVRNDLEKAYTFTNVNIKRNGESIPCAAIDYKTIDGKQYRTLVVHIPNKFIETEEAIQETHAAFEAYTKEAEKKGITVTGYLGDTNFKKAYYTNTAPSVGGIMEGGETLKPQSSGAQEETNFMQAIPLIKNNKEVAVLQPSAANYIFIKTESNNKVATDHPSMLSYTAHSSPLYNREPDKMPEFYPMEL